MPWMTRYQKPGLSLRAPEYMLIFLFLFCCTQLPLSTLNFLYQQSDNFLTPVWKCRQGSKNLQRIPTPWGLPGDQYKAFQAIFEILQRQDSKTCPGFCREYQFLCQNMSFKASNTKMMVQNVAWNEKIHIYFKFGVISFTIVDFSIFHFVLPSCVCHKEPKSTIMDKIAPNLE